MNILQLAIKGQEPLIDGEFYKRVIVDDSFWTLEDGDFGKHYLFINMILNEYFLIMI
jgi:hypothetical protein